MSVIKKALESASTANTSLIKPDAKTWNGDNAYSTTTDPRLDLFFSGFVRGCSENKLNSMMKLSWAKYPEDTVKLVIHSRDCRSGKGEKKVSYQGMLWLRKYKPLTYIMNLPTFLNYGCFKDLLQLAAFSQDLKLNPLGCEGHYLELELIAEFLADDIDKFNRGEKSLSLAAKWAPSEGKYFDKQYGFASDIAGILFPNYNEKDSLKKYRTTLTSLRKHLNVVETLVTSNKWNEIKYSHVPAKAHRLLRKAFLKHCPEEYRQYLDNLIKGKVKINITGTHPHDLVREYLNNRNNLDETIEGQWKALVEDTRSKGLLKNTIAISDVSGSMTGTPMEVSIALGILIAQCCEGTFGNKIITFSQNPQVQALKGDNLQQLVSFTKNIEWGMNTDLDKVFGLLLNIAKLNDVSEENMIKNIVIISDMQFDSAVGSTLTIFQRNRKLFEDAGYKLPNIVFWNVNGAITSIPVQTHESGSILISGFSAELLKDLIKNGFDCDPIGFLLSVISKYDVAIDEYESTVI